MTAPRTTARRWDFRRVSDVTTFLWWRWVLLLATVVGLVAMHQLAGGASPVGADHPTDTSVPGVAVDLSSGSADPPTGFRNASLTSGSAAAERPGCTSDDNGHGGDCSDDDPHGHPGQVCQPAPPSGQALAAPVLAVRIGVLPVSRPVITPGTTAPTAADGSGCGPPSLTLLSISRT